MVEEDSPSQLNGPRMVTKSTEFNLTYDLDSMQVEKGQNIEVSGDKATDEAEV